LELLALGAAQDGEALVVQGTVRGPGWALPPLTAVVSVLGRDGDVISGGHSQVDASALAGGGEASFAVAVPDANGAGRYRVSFRTTDQVVPHIDRRHRTVSVPR
jgi:hypothetical protein